MAERLRLFFGMPLPDTLLTRALEAQSELQHWRAPPRLIAERNLHLTLKFMGYVEKSQTDALAASLLECTRDRAPIAVTARDLAAFPKPRGARVIALELDDPEALLTELASALDAAATPFGVPREKRPFRAHVTLGRFPEPVDVRRAIEHSRFAPLSVVLDRVRLYQSILLNSGSEYGALAEAELNAGSGTRGGAAKRAV